MQILKTIFISIITSNPENDGVMKYACVYTYLIGNDDYVDGTADFGRIVYSEFTSA